MFILSILFTTVAVLADCTSHTTIGDCGADNTCNWKPGKCNPFGTQDCTLANCPLGCDYTAAVPGSCENEAIAECAADTSGNCDAVDDDGSRICDLSSGTCVSSNPPVTCPAEIDDYDYCPDGCVEGNGVSYCELPAQPPSPPSYCDGWSVAPGKSECETDESCKVSSGSCVRDSSGPAFDICGEIGIGNCNETEGNCKIVNNQCVESDPNSYCSTLSTSPRSDCEKQSEYCKASDGKCVEKTADERCSVYKVTGGVSACENQYLCKVSSGFCVFDSSVEGGDGCSQFGTESCVEESFGDCYVSNGKCVSQVNYNEYCREFSTVPISECGSHSHDCKVSGDKCLGLTADDKCSVYSVTASFSECDSDYHCYSMLPEGEGEGEGEHYPEGEGEGDHYPEGEGDHYPEGEGDHYPEGEGDHYPEGEGDHYPEGEGEHYPEGEGEGGYPGGRLHTARNAEVQGTGTCVSLYYGYEELCSSLSTTLTISSCERNSDGKCGVNSKGACASLSPVTPDCKLNAAKTGCNNPNGCNFYTKKSCKNNVVCDGYFSQNQCESRSYWSYSQNDWVKYCSWESADTDSCKPAISCDVNSDGSCNTAHSSCKSTDPTDARCDLASSPAICNQATVSGCNQVTGCKWNSTDGGICEPKTCANSPSYARCCPNDEADCGYCSGVSKPSDCPSPKPDPNTDPNTDPKCTNNPTYSNCCPGIGCDTYCTLFSDDSNCDARASLCGSNPGDSVCAGYCTSDLNGSICGGYCKANPDESICASRKDSGGSSHIFAPFIPLSLLLLWILL